MDIQTTGQVIHALAALRDCNGNLAQAAARLGVSEDAIRRALAQAGPNFYTQSADGSIQPTEMGLRFADRVGTFPHVNW